MRPGRLRRPAACLAAPLLLVCGAVTAAETDTDADAAALTEVVPQHRVRIEGSGPRTVILESGLGDTLEVWKDVQERIANGCSRTLAYNRAGYEGSEPSDAPRDAAVIVSELRAELQRRAIPPPYVLVGHSLGGLYMQYFARNFPGEVAGLVLVDSSHWNEGLALGTPGNTPYFGRTVVQFYMPFIMRREVDDSVAAGREVRDSPPAGGLPTVVLSSTLAGAGRSEAARQRAAQLQDEIAADYPSAWHVYLPDTGHYIQHDRPDAVVAAARRLAGCGEEAQERTVPSHGTPGP